MGVHGIVANDAAVGGTIGTFDPIDTRNGDIRLRSGTTAVVGLVAAVGRTAQTTGDAQLYRLRITSSDLGLAAGSADFLLGASQGGGTATNSGAVFFPAEWIALEVEAGGGNVVNAFLSQAGIESADSVEIEVAVAHMTGLNPPPSTWFDRASVGGVLPRQGGISSNGGSSADARTSLTSATIPARFPYVVSMRNGQAQDAVPAAGEASLAFFEYTATIGDWEPQEWPAAAIAASLGTATGAGPGGSQPDLPFWFQKGEQTETVEPFVDVLTAIGAANAFAWGLGLRATIGGR